MIYGQKHKHLKTEDDTEPSLQSFSGLALLSSLSLALVLGACGSPQMTTPTPAGTPSGVSTTATQNTPTPMPTVTPTGNSNTVSNQQSQGYLVFETDFQVYGNDDRDGNPSTYTINDIETDNILRIEISATSPGSIDGTGYSIPFDCLKYSVKVGSSTRSILTSTTGNDITSGVCKGAKANPVINFDTEAQKAGHGAFTATITAETYDNCRKRMNPWYGQGEYWETGCTLNQVYKTHQISGTIKVYVTGPTD
jgi:hypothetical protein